MSSSLVEDPLPFGYVCTLWTHDENLKEDVIYNPDRVPGDILAAGRLARMAAFNSSTPIRNNRDRAARLHRANTSYGLREREDYPEAGTLNRHDCNESVAVTIDEDSGRTESRSINRENSFLFSPCTITAEMKMKQSALQVNMRKIRIASDIVD